MPTPCSYGLYHLTLDGRATRLAEGNRCGLQVGADRYVRWNQGQVLDLLDHGRRTVLLRTHRCGIGSVGADRARRRISYTVACEDRSKPIVGLWTMDLAARKATRVLAEPVYGAAWSPDGAWLATTRFHERPDGRPDPSIWVIRTDGTDGRTVASGGLVNDPTWGPSTTSGSTAS